MVSEIGACTCSGSCGLLLLMFWCMLRKQMILCSCDSVIDFNGTGYAEVRWGGLFCSTMRNLIVTYAGSMLGAVQVRPFFGMYLAAGQVS